MHDLRSRVNEVGVRVRASPFGQDRYNRYFWILPHHSGIFVEGVESGGVNNPAVKQAPTIAAEVAGRRSVSPPKQPDEVGSCVHDMVDAISRACADESDDVEAVYAEVKLERARSTSQ